MEIQVLTQNMNHLTDLMKPVKVLTNLPDEKPGLIVMANDQNTTLLMGEVSSTFIRNDLRIRFAILSYLGEGYVPYRAFDTKTEFLYKSESNLYLRKAFSQRMRSLFRKIKNSLPENFTREQAEACLRESTEFKDSVAFY